MRFLYPVYFIPEVEIVAGKFTSGYTLEKGNQIRCTLIIEFVLIQGHFLTKFDSFLNKWAKLPFFDQVQSQLF